MAVKGVAASDLLKQDVKFTCLGLSSDWRTNRWRISLECGHSVEPMTTMFATQFVTCHRCSREFLLNYNKLTSVEVLA